MEKVMSLAVVILVLFILLGGIPGLLLCAALAVPIGVILTIVGFIMGWLK